MFDPDDNDVTPASPASSRASTPRTREAGVIDPPIVTPTGSNLFFLQQPTTTVVNATMAPPVRVRVLDNAGAALPGVTVTMSLNVPGVVISGNAAVTDATGVATFGALQIDTPGTGYILTATRRRHRAGLGAIQRIQRAAAVLDRRPRGDAVVDASRS